MTKTSQTKPAIKRPRKMAREPQVQATPGTETDNELAIQPADPQPKRPARPAYCWSF